MGYKNDIYKQGSSDVKILFSLQKEKLQILTMRD